MINVPPGQDLHTAVWTGSQMIVWGGYGESNFANTGGRYNPSMNSWTTTSTANAPTARSSHTAVWTGTEMIVWGGFNRALSILVGDMIPAWTVGCQQAVTAHHQRESPTPRYGPAVK